MKKQIFFYSWLLLVLLNSDIYAFGLMRIASEFLLVDVIGSRIRLFSSHKPHSVDLEYKTRIVKSLGEEGKNWLRNLPSITTHLTDQWGLADIQYFPSSSQDYITRAVQKSNNLEVIMKIGAPRSALMCEALASQAFSGNGCMPLLQYDTNANAFLREFVEPGTTLGSMFPYKDKEAITQTVNIFKKLHTPSNFDRNNFPTIENWLASLNNNLYYSIDERHLKKARKLATFLLNSQENPILLHGDLHHENILFCRKRGWIAIDPKGVIGERAYEVGAFVRNPMPLLLQLTNVEDLIADRINLFAFNLNINPTRLKNWCYVQSILSACWAEEDGGNSLQWLSCAKIIDKLDAN